MGKSKHRPEFKVKKKKFNTNKQKQREMANQAKNLEQPRTFVYNKNKETVEVPIKAWQTLNEAANQLQSIALFVTTMELVGQQHMTDGTLLPVFDKDLVPSGVKNPNGTDQLKIKDSFWETKSEKPTQVIIDGTTVYDESKTVSPTV